MPSRQKTCGYCGKKLGDFYYKDMSRVRGWFCSGEHFSRFLEHGPIVRGLREDEETSLHELNQEGFADYAERDGVKEEE